MASQPDQTRDPACAVPDPTLHQPWKAVFPLTPESPLYSQLMEKHPEVLSWSFDTTKLLSDHPWQSWKPQTAVNELAADDLETMSAISDADSLLTDCSAATAVSDASTLPAVRENRDDLDAFVQLANLPSVTPTEFNYLAPLDLYRREKPYRLQLPALDGVKLTNLVAKGYSVNIHDISGFESRFDLTNAGFRFTKCPVPVTQWTDDFVTSSYIPQLQDWLMDTLDCESTFVYSYNFRHGFEAVDRHWDNPTAKLLAMGRDNRVEASARGTDYHHSLRSFVQDDRHNDPFNDIGGVSLDPIGPNKWKRPFFRVHCDASMNTPLARLKLSFPDKYKELLKKRVRLLGIWRSLSAPVQDTPLAFCDFRTLNPDDDLVPMDIVYPHFVDEVYEVLHNPSHRWFYKKDMELDDVVMFKLHDTLKTEATVAPHSAFSDPTAPADTPSRSSLEIKVMVFG